MSALMRSLGSSGSLCGPDVVTLAVKHLAVNREEVSAAAIAVVSWGGIPVLLQLITHNTAYSCDTAHAVECIAGRVARTTGRSFWSMLESPCIRILLEFGGTDTPGALQLSPLRNCPPSDRLCEAMHREAACRGVRTRCSSCSNLRSCEPASGTCVRT